jgi:hypothetical protein
LPALAKAKAAAQRTQCLSQQKQIGLAFHCTPVIFKTTWFSRTGG